MKVINIGRKKVGGGNPCFIIAEISCNHRQRFTEAVKLVKAAAKAGADAVKFQTSTPDELTLPLRKKPFLVDSKNLPKEWKTSLHDLYQKTYTPWEWFPKLKKEATKVGLQMFSTPFGNDSVDFLERLGVPCFKVASYEALDIPLLRKIAKTGKPVIISEGFYPLKDVIFSIKTLQDAGVKQIAALHCVTQYSANPDLSEVNLRTMLDLRERFDIVCGLSDNNGGIEVAAIAVAMGASIVEKHLVLKHGQGSLDDQFSLDPKEFSEMVREIRRVEKVIGTVKYGLKGVIDTEAKKFCRSLFVSEPVKKGEVFTEKNVRSIRPSAGMSPRYWDDVIGKVSQLDIEAGTPLSWKMIRGTSRR